MEEVILQMDLEGLTGFQKANGLVIKGIWGMLLFM